MYGSVLGQLAALRLTTTTERSGQHDTQQQDTHASTQSGHKTVPCLHSDADVAIHHDPGGAAMARGAPFPHGQSARQTRPLAMSSLGCVMAGPVPAIQV